MNTQQTRYNAFCRSATLHGLGRRPVALAVVTTCLAVLVSTQVSGARTVHACPFCSTASQTLSQEITAADVAAIAELEKPMAASDAGTGGSAGAPDDFGAAKFRIVETLRGADALQGKTEVDVVYFGEATNKRFLLTGLTGNKHGAAPIASPAAPDTNVIDWTTPLPLSAPALDYVRKLSTLPAGGAERLVFFQQYFEHEDPLLAQDAYDEFSRTPYADVKALGPQMEHGKLLSWIENPRVGPSSRRLYLTMLGVCGSKDDVPRLEQILSYDYEAVKPCVAAALGAWCGNGWGVGVGLLDDVLHAEERRQKESLDAMIACYLILKGPEGLELIDRLYLGNPKVEYKYLHSAIMALRFHGEETTVVPRERLLQSMRLALDHREFADQVLPDLTRWEDWSILERLVTMFKASPADDWIRQPVASYLLVASEQAGEVGVKATAALEELTVLDPQTVKRARSLQAFSMLPRSMSGASIESSTAPASTASASTASASTASSPSDPIDGATPPTEAVVDSVAIAAIVAPEEGEVPPAFAQPTVTDEQVAGDGTETNDVPTPEAGVAVQGDVAKDATASSPAGSSPLGASPAVASQSEPLKAPSTLMLVGTPLLVGILLVGVFAVMLRASDPGSESASLGATESGHAELSGAASVGDDEA